MDITNFIKNNSGIEKALKEVTGLSFTKKIILHFGKESKSEPLTIKQEDIEDMYDNLIHELIHVLFTQNYKGKFKKKWDKYMEVFEDLPWATRCHIAVHAVHLLVAQKITANRILNIKTYSKNPDYQLAWNIVDDRGARSIVRMLK